MRSEGSAHADDTPTIPASSTTPEQATAERKDRRRSVRRRVLKEGKLVYGSAQAVVDCVIDNVNDGGAHIRITGSHGVPHDFYLVEANRGIIHKAEIAWRTATGMGLRVLGPVEDAVAREGLLRRFRRN